MPLKYEISIRDKKTPALQIRPPSDRIPYKCRINVTAIIIGNPHYWKTNRKKR